VVRREELRAQLSWRQPSPSSVSHRPVSASPEILAMIRMLGALVGATEKAEVLARGYERHLADAVAMAADHPRPRVYFEEWDDPLISGISWVSQLIEIAGGEDVFADLAVQKAAKDRIAATAARLPRLTTESTA
jgi:ABC-type Fe3+-hydroxamate transport system substrate-binding protein